MMILICQVNKVEAKKGGGGEYHAGKIVKYLGYKDFNRKLTYLVQFEDKTEENVHGWDLWKDEEIDIKVSSQWLQ